MTKAERIEVGSHRINNSLTDEIIAAIEAEGVTVLKNNKPREPMEYLGELYSNVLTLLDTPINPVIAKWLTDLRQRRETDLLLSIIFAQAAENSADGFIQLTDRNGVPYAKLPIFAGQTDSVFLAMDLARVGFGITIELEPNTIRYFEEKGKWPEELEKKYSKQKEDGVEETYTAIYSILERKYPEYTAYLRSL